MMIDHKPTGSYKVCVKLFVYVTYYMHGNEDHVWIYTNRYGERNYINIQSNCLFTFPASHYI
jgi:methyltransferase-like protein